MQMFMLVIGKHWENSVRVVYKTSVKGYLISSASPRTAYVRIYRAIPFIPAISFFPNRNIFSIFKGVPVLYLSLSEVT